MQHVCFTLGRGHLRSTPVGLNSPALTDYIMQHPHFTPNSALTLKWRSILSSMSSSSCLARASTFSCSACFIRCASSCASMSSLPGIFVVPLRTELLDAFTPEAAWPLRAGNERMMFA